MPDKKNLPSKVDPEEQHPPTESDGLIKQFLENQSRELGLRSEELVLKKQQEQNAFAYGKEALGGKLSDRREQRGHLKSIRKMTLMFAGGVIFLLVLLIGYALHVGKDAVALEIIKALVFVSGGALGGYGFASAKAAKQATNQSENK